MFIDETVLGQRKVTLVLKSDCWWANQALDITMFVGGHVFFATVLARLVWWRCLVCVLCVGCVLLCACSDVVVCVCFVIFSQVNGVGEMCSKAPLSLAMHTARRSWRPATQALATS